MKFTPTYKINPEKETTENFVKWLDIFLMNGIKMKQTSFIIHIPIYITIREIQEEIEPALKAANYCSMRVYRELSIRRV
jgi:hypothetical protein